MSLLQRDETSPSQIRTAGYMLHENAIFVEFQSTPMLDCYFVTVISDEVTQLVKAETRVNTFVKPPTETLATPC
ncbi:hypothetical protein T11_9274 [Trichinella zimbabwensis]|uniref:Uncharacterized protein n=1 Tax=Trichinella zimbabwensis TaxID=268475 RepID=A0A0V1I998_9BILA|nr:hypothetical protein T11_9274 [Trichinella zimbabwensis]